MLIKIRHVVSDSTRFGIGHQQYVTLSQNNPSSKLLMVPSLKGNNGSLNLSRRDKNRRTHVVVYNGVEPAGGIPPSGPPPNALSWVVAVAIGVVIPFIGYKWGPTIKNKVESVIKRTEDVVEAVEKVAEKVEEVAEDILDDMSPEGGRVREAVEYVEKLAERTRKDAGTVDDFIDKVQEEEEKAESLMASLEDNKSKTHSEELKDETKIILEDPKQK